MSANPSPASGVGDDVGVVLGAIRVRMHKATVGFGDVGRRVLVIVNGVVGNREQCCWSRCAAADTSLRGVQASYRLLNPLDEKTIPSTLEWMCIYCEVTHHDAFVQARHLLQTRDTLFVTEHRPDACTTQAITVPSRSSGPPTTFHSPPHRPRRTCAHHHLRRAVSIQTLPRHPLPRHSRVVTTSLSALARSGCGGRWDAKLFGP
jgi:hypothetical protein